MKKNIKSVLKYCMILFITVAILFTLMLVSIITIPREKIKENVIESIPTLDSTIELKRPKIERYYTYLHVYADEILLNVIYCIDTTNPMQSMMEAKYYKDNFFPSLEGAIINESNGNTQYMRYWHGSMTIIRPLLTIMNIEQIYYMFAIIIMALVIYLIILFCKRKSYILILALVVGWIMTGSIYVPFCLEYTWAYLIMLIGTIIAIKLENKENGASKINILMFIIGIVTTYFDFLSTETLTFLIPIICVFTIRYKEKRIQSLKQEIKQILLWMFLWFIGYSVMWGIKWLLASLILQVNALDYVVENAIVRLYKSNNERTLILTIINAIKKNFITLYPLYSVKNRKIFAGVFTAIVALTILLRKKNKEDLKTALVLLGIGIIPYIRYIVVSSHSRGHYFFTFRAQLATIMAIIIVIYILIDRKKLTKEINIKEVFIKKLIERKKRKKKMELTILIPALNEEKTIEIVIKKAKKWIQDNKVDAEVLIANNNSIDKTKEIAIKNGARVVDVENKGYGNALWTGIKSALGKYIIMGDADDSYNFLEITEIYNELKNGNDLVIGNRFHNMEKGAMKWSHRYIGTPMLTFLIRKIYKVNIKDVNCGLRGMKKDKIIELNLETTGMEFASEMIIKADQNKLKIKEVPINFYKDKRNHKAHLNTIKDGIRHLKVILKNIRIVCS